MKCVEATTKDCLLKILDFSSGLTEDFALVGRYRCVVAIASLAVSRSFERGRRAMEGIGYSATTFMATGWHLLHHGLLGVQMFCDCSPQVDEADCQGACPEDPSIPEYYRFVCASQF